MFTLHIPKLTGWAVRLTWPNGHTELITDFPDKAAAGEFAYEQNQLPDADAPKATRVHRDRADQDWEER